MRGRVESVIWYRARYLSPVSELHRHSLFTLVLDHTHLLCGESVLDEMPQSPPLAMSSGSTHSAVPECIIALNLLQPDPLT